ncbi:hypothetical protein RM780_22320 [Streptomyces sp. DSM 44917]|uniref:Uncharacterized protein n=1 Tax=Streptomyces boetiae TaxID=3075541 RepID=A0ABU2LDV3_9ACTN|nr:hypothetical protein [Streptomyces sp. DSM 44917]MDT0309671.1 hypothetical protein [Streptomyces sp. DSM 44917]
MYHESRPSAPTPERHENGEDPRRLFNVERMEPREVVGLVCALGVALEAKEREADGSSHSAPEVALYDELLDSLYGELREVARTSDKALEIYRELTESDLSTDASKGGAVEMVPDLLRRHLDNPDVKRQITDSLVAMLRGGGLAYDGARLIVSQLVWQADWLDEPTARFLDSHLPDEAQRW